MQKIHKNSNSFLIWNNSVSRAILTMLLFFSVAFTVNAQKMYHLPFYNGLDYDPVTDTIVQDQSDQLNDWISTRLNIPGNSERNWQILDFWAAYNGAQLGANLVNTDNWFTFASYKDVLPKAALLISPGLLIDENQRAKIRFVYAAAGTIESVEDLEVLLRKGTTQFSLNDAVQILYETGIEGTDNTGSAYWRVFEYEINYADFPGGGIYYIIFYHQSDPGSNAALFIDSISVSYFVPINAEAGPGGSVSPTYKEVTPGEVATISVTPNSGFVIDEITLNGEPYYNYQGNNIFLQTNAGDYEHNISVTFKERPRHTVPYNYDFGDNDPINHIYEWATFNQNGDGVFWTRGQERSGNWAARMSAGTESLQNDILVSPPVRYEGGDIMVSYRYRVESNEFTELLNVVLTKESEQTNNASANAIAITNTTDMISINSTTWQTMRKIITENEITAIGGGAASSNLFLKFHCSSIASQSFPWIDNVRIVSVVPATVNASCNIGGSVSPSTQNALVYEEATISITCNTGYIVSEIRINGVPQTLEYIYSQDFTFEVPSATTNVQVVFVPTPIYSVPYGYDFGDNNSKLHWYEWTVLDANSDNVTWIRDQDNDGNLVARMSNYASSSQNDILISPPIGFGFTANSDLKITYRYKVANSNYSENLAVVISRDIQPNDPTFPHLSNKSYLVSDLQNINNTDWIYAREIITGDVLSAFPPNLELSTYLYLKFISFSDADQRWLLIDNVRISYQTPAVVNVTCNAGGSVTPTQMNTEVYDIETISITCNTGYMVGGITINGVSQALPVTTSQIFSFEVPSATTNVNVTFVPRPTINLPYFYDFVDASHWNNWSIFDVNRDGITWRRLNNNGNWTARMSQGTSVGNGPQNDILVSPPINYGGGDIQISYRYKGHGNTSEYVEKVRVVLTRETEPTTNLTSNMYLITDKEIITSDWEQVTVNFTAAEIANLGGTGNFLYIKFLCYSDENHWYPYIDDISINVTSPTVHAFTDGNGTISPSGYSYPVYGSSITYTITPNTDYTLESIEVDGVAIPNPTNTYTLTNIVSDREVYVKFLPIYTIQASVRSANGSGTITPSGTIRLVSGSNQTFTITPTIGWEIDRFLVNGVETALTTATTYTINGILRDYTIEVYFKKIVCYVSISVSGGNGSVNPMGSDIRYEYGDVIPLKFTPASNYVINSVMVNGVGQPVRPDATGYNLVVVESGNVVVTYRELAYSVTVNIVGAGSVNSKYGVVTSGETITVERGGFLDFDFIFDDRHKIDNISVDYFVIPASQYPNNKYTVRDIVLPHTLTVTFAPIYHKVTTFSTAGGRIIPSDGEYTYQRGTRLPVFFMPNNETTELVKLVINGEEITNYRDSVYMISYLDRDYNIEAFFDAKLYTIEVSSDGGGYVAASAGGDYLESGSQIKVGIYNDKEFWFVPWPGFIVSEVKVNGRAVDYIRTIKEETTSEGNIIYDTTYSYTFVYVTANAYLDVYFAPIDPDMVVIMATAKNGTITPNGGITVTPGFDQTFTFAPDDGYKFDELIVNAIPINVTSNSYTFKNVPAPTIKRDPITGDIISAIGANLTIEAKFTPITYTIDVKTNIVGGSIVPDGILVLPYRSNEVFKFIPDDGYELDINSVMVNGNPVNIFIDPTTGFMMYPVHVYQNLTISAAFIENTGNRTITASAGIGGTITPSGDVSVPYMDDQTFKIIPDENYKVNYIEIDGNILDYLPESIEEDSTYTFEEVIKNHTIHIEFEFVPGTIVSIFANSGENGTISPSGIINKPQGSSQLFTFTPIFNYVVDSVWVNDKLVGFGPSFTSYTITNITQGMNINVTFAKGTGITEDNRNFYLYPNPTSSVINLQGDISEIIRIEVLDYAGSKMLEFNKISNQIDMSKLPNGTYTIRVMTKDNNIEIHSVVKIK